MNKQNYIAPETKEIQVRLKTQMLQGSAEAMRSVDGSWEKEEEW